MAIFAVFGASDPEILDNLIAVNFDHKFKLNDGEWFVSVEPGTTTKEVASKISSDGSAGRCVIVPVTNYWGWHTSDTWEWLGKQVL
jgi:hypothetical protein